MAFVNSQQASSGTFDARPWLGVMKDVTAREFERATIVPSEVILSSVQAQLTMMSCIHLYMVWQRGVIPEELMERFKRVFYDLQIDDNDIVYLDGIPLYKFLRFYDSNGDGLSLLYLVTIVESVQEVIQAGLIQSLGSRSLSCTGQFDYASIENVWDATGNVCLGKKRPRN